MADVSDPPGRSRRERAQMMLVAAFGIAALLVALALILNTSIYTENIATRGSDISGGKDAQRYRVTTEATVERAVVVTNYENNSTADADGNYDALDGGVRASVGNYSNLSGRQLATNGIAANVSLKRSSEGTRVVQYGEDDNFTSEAHVGNWTVAKDTDGVRNFTLNVTETSLADESVGGATFFNEIFYVNFSAGGEWYRIFVYDDSGANQVVVEVEDDGGTSDTCTENYDSYAGEDRARINITNASIEGSRCEALENWTPILDKSFDVHLNNTCRTTAGLLFGSNDCAPLGSSTYTANGSYSFVVNKTFADVDVEEGINTASREDPDKTRAVYSARVHLIYESRRLYYETDIRVAPGEPDG